MSQDEADAVMEALEFDADEAARLEEEAYWEERNAEQVSYQQLGLDQERYEEESGPRRRW